MSCLARLIAQLAAHSEIAVTIQLSTAQTIAMIVAIVVIMLRVLSSNILALRFVIRKVNRYIVPRQNFFQNFSANFLQVSNLIHTFAIATIY